MDFNLVKNRKELGTADAQVGRFFFSFFRCVQEPLMREHGNLVTVPLIWGKSQIR